MLWVALALGGCAAPCETGADCARRCPSATHPQCVAHGLCGCVIEPLAADLGPTWSTIDGGVAPAEPPTGRRPDAPIGAGSKCTAPTVGAMVINEVLLDGEPTEDEEFIELVSLADAPLDLAGVQVTSNRGAERVRRVEFIGGCLPAGGAVALYASAQRWQWAPPPDAPPDVEIRSFGFANKGAFDFRLLDAGGGVLDRFAGDGSASRPGVSINRAPDRIGSALVAHDDRVLDSDGPTSPARCASGGSHAEGCMLPDDARTRAPDDAGASPVEADASAADMGPVDAGPADAADERPPCEAPEPGELVMAEVLVDGANPRIELDEFVEVVSRAGHPLDLAGVRLGVQSGGDPPDVRVRLSAGCLPPFGAMVIRPRLEDWGWHPPLAWAAEVELARLALGNDGGGALILSRDEAVILDRLDLAGAPIVEGVSLRRAPEPAGPELIRHDRYDPESQSSPGTCADGSPFSGAPCPDPWAPEPCPVAVPGELMINEVLVDGVEPDERDEFIEIVNLADRPRRLGGVQIWSTSGDGVMIERMTLPPACLGGGAAVAVRGDSARWVWSTPPETPLASVEGRLGLANGVDTTVRLISPGSPEPTLVEVAVPRALIRPGISVTRAVDGDPDSEWVTHDALGGDASPGARADGGAFGDAPEVPDAGG